MSRSECIRDDALEECAVLAEEWARENPFLAGRWSLFDYAKEVRSRKSSAAESIANDPEFKRLATRMLSVRTEEGAEETFSILVRYVDRLLKEKR